MKAATGEWFVDLLSSVQIVVSDVTAITRCTENHTDEGVPATTGEAGWCDNFYPLYGVEDVMQHWAYNCALNGIEDVSRLEGWADLPEGAVTMNYERAVGYERVVEPLALADEVDR